MGDSGRMPSPGLDTRLHDRKDNHVSIRCESERLQVAGMPQGSPISPILYLFYNPGLMNTRNPRNMRAHGLGFIDDVNITE
jgi:hypothetical protein